MSQKHHINIPGVILDELRDKDYSNDGRFHLPGKRKHGKQLSRKEKRKQERSIKRQKRSSKKTTHLNDDEQPIRKETKSQIYTNKKPKNTTSTSQKKEDKTFKGLPFSSDDELSSGDFDGFGDNDLNSEEWEQLKEMEESEASDDVGENENESAMEEDDEKSGSDVPMTAEETMAELKKSKELKNCNKNSKQKDLKSKVKAKSEKEAENGKEHNVYPLLPSERAALERDEMDMQYYAKKLNLKGKKKELHAKDEYDAVGGLLEGLDFFENYGEGDEEYGDFALNNKQASNNESEDESESDGSEDAEDSEGSSEEVVENPFSSDDELSSGDFEDFDEEDLNEEELEQLRELEENTKSKSTKKENPYVAPVVEMEQTTEYIPPSLRKKLSEEDDQENAIKATIRKKVKSTLNKISDSNVTIMITTLNELYDEFPRNYVNEIIIKQILDIVGQSNKLLDGFIMNYSAVAFVLFKCQGMETGAAFIQAVVETFLSFYNKQMEDWENKNHDETITVAKNCTNILTLLAYCYNFGFVSCRLIYDLIHLFVEKPNEATTELLLRVISVSGPLIRGDDPSALKEILSELLSNVKTIEEQSPRLQFLLSTLSDLKNNRLKSSVIATDFRPLKKSLANLIKSSNVESLQVSLQDIENTETKGKWWLVGASWKGSMTSAFENKFNQTDVSNTEQDWDMNDVLLDDIPDWGRIAREQRMNTDVRRAIFISIMSAQDYVDAFEKLEKLNLKNKQALEIPRVLLHCLLTDSGQNGYNPYYSLVASKVCEHNHQLLKSFQFLFWDTVKQFEKGSESDSENEINDQNDTTEQSLRKVASQGRFFGYLISQNILKLDGFKHVPIMGGLSADGNIFIEVILFQMFLSIGKKSEKKNGKDGKGNKLYKYIDEHLLTIINNGLKPENKSTILKSLKWFITKKLKYGNYITGKKGDNNYKRDVRRIQWALAKFNEIVDAELGETAV